MSFEKHLKAKGVDLTEDSTLPVGQRTIKNFKRCIAAIRAAEAESNDAIKIANDRCREAQNKLIALQAYTSKLEKELNTYRMKVQLDKMETLTTFDKTKLLEAVSGQTPEADEQQLDSSTVQ